MSFHQLLVLSQRLHHRLGAHHVQPVLQREQTDVEVRVVWREHNTQVPGHELAAGNSLLVRASVPHALLREADKLFVFHALEVQVFFKMVPHVLELVAVRAAQPDLGTDLGKQYFCEVSVVTFCY